MWLLSSPRADGSQAFSYSRLAHRDETVLVVRVPRVGNRRRQ